MPKFLREIWLRDKLLFIFYVGFGLTSAEFVVVLILIIFRGFQTYPTLGLIGIMTILLKNIFQYLFSWRLNALR